VNGDADRDVNDAAGKGRHKLSGGEVETWIGQSEPGGHCGGDSC
jgi:hypothetical protein